MAPPSFDPGDDTYVGVFMVEQPPDWWLPEGYTLTPNGGVPIDVAAPDGSTRYAYIDPSYRPPPARIEAITEVIRRELGPVPTQGIGPETRQALGMDRDDALGAINRTIMAPVDLGVWLIDLANYGIDAGVVGGTEGAARAGWLDPDTASGARKAIFELLEFVGIESGARIGSLAAETRAARLSIATAVRASRLVAAPIVMRLERATGLPFGRAFRVVSVFEADTPFPGARERTVDGWLTRVRAGKTLERQQIERYRFNQIYVVKNTGSGYRILDFYGPTQSWFGAGPVSFKTTQLADIKVASANAALQEAYRNFRPGTVIADVPSRPDLLTERTLSGQLWLEVPVQTKPVPSEVLATAKRLSIRIRDIAGTVYE